MRALFLFLVLANVVFFAWARFIAPPEATVDPAPLSRQIDPGKLKILAPGELPAALPKPAPATPVAATAVAVTCMEWGSFTLADAPKAEKALEPLALAGRLGQRRTEETAGWWVFIPPQGNRQAAAKKTAELKVLGVEDYFVVVEEGQFHWAVSLGVFRTEEAARARLLALRAQGVRSAQIGPRETVVPKIWLQVKGVDAALEGRLKEIARQIDGSELRNCEK